MHAFADPRRIGEAGGDHISGGDTGRTDRDLTRRIEPEHVEHLEDANELVAESVLERDAAGVDPPRDEKDLFMFDVHAFHRTDAGGKMERLGLAERLGREPATPSLPYDRWVEAFLDGRPDGEGRAEVVALDHEIRPVPDTDLVDRGEQLVRRIPSEDVRQPRLDAHADQREETALLPLRAVGELLVTELDPGPGVGVLGIGMRERHRHVHISDPGGQGRPEDRHDETGIDCIEDGVAPLGTEKCRDGRLVRGVQLHPREAIRRRLGRPLGPPTVVVGNDHLLERVALRRNAGKRGPHPSCPHYQHFHSVGLPRGSPPPTTLSVGHPG